MADRPASTSTSPGNRIASLDQFRGYTVAGMLLVNFIGGFTVVPAIFKHHNIYCSYADTIMSQFFFAVGFAGRLTYLKRTRNGSKAAANWAVARRCAALLLLGFSLYHLDGGAKSWAELETLGVSGFFRTAFRREVFQTLVHIGLATLWVLPVMGAGMWTRVGFLIGTAVLHLGLSWWFYFDYAWKTPVIDGGPLGFMSWSIPVLVGSLTYDAVVAGHRRSRVMTRLVGWSVVLMVVGYGIACLGGMAPPPFVPPNGPITLWTMSQRTGSISYQIFGAGFSLAVYALFLLLCDGTRLRLDIGLFRPFGRNALAAYVLHGIVGGAVKPYVPRDSPAWYVAAAFVLYYAINWLFVRGMEKDGTFVRL